MCAFVALFGWVFLILISRGNYIYSHIVYLCLSYSLLLSSKLWLYCLVSKQFMRWSGYNEASISLMQMGTWVKRSLNLQSILRDSAMRALFCSVRRQDRQNVCLQDRGFERVYVWCRSERIALEGHKVGIKWNQGRELNSTACGAIA